MNWGKIEKRLPPESVTGWPRVASHSSEGRSVESPTTSQWGLLYEGDNYHRGLCKGDRF
jgi:hypothetical protein